MKENYDFSSSASNPYINRLGEQVTLTLGKDVLDYFQQLEKDFDIPYQRIITMYLRDCVANQRSLSIQWSTPSNLVEKSTAYIPTDEAQSA
ncbi:MAG: antitoxin [Cyanobacteria bacterium J06635_1]